MEPPGKAQAFSRVCRPAAAPPEEDAIDDPGSGVQPMAIVLKDSKKLPVPEVMLPGTRSTKDLRALCNVPLPYKILWRHRMTEGLDGWATLFWAM